MTRERDRIEKLLVDETTIGLSREEQQELAGLLATHPDVDRYAFERAAAAVFLALQGNSLAPMPQTLYSRIVTDGQRAIEESE